MNRRYLLLLSYCISILFFSCSFDEEENLPQPELSKYNQELIAYFKEIALGFENDDSIKITRKWQSTMKVFIEGELSTELITKVEEVVHDINMMTTDGFFIELVTDKNLANCYIFFGAKSDFITLYPDAVDQMEDNYAIFNVWWQSNVIYEARIFIDTEQTNLLEQKSLILEEITQSLGLGKDSEKYPNSIFYETSTDGGFVLNYSELDKDLIRLLYHKEMGIGLNEDQTEYVLTRILTKEISQKAQDF